jgi:hypothetical protein
MRSVKISAGTPAILDTFCGHPKSLYAIARAVPPLSNEELAPDHLQFIIPPSKAMKILISSHQMSHNKQGQCYIGGKNSMHSQQSMCIYIYMGYMLMCSQTLN